MRQLGSVRPVLLWTGVIILLVVPWYSWQTHPHWERVQWSPVTSSFKLRDVVGNLLLYLPLGYLARRRWPEAPVGRLVGLALILSLATEWTQVFSHLRFPSMRDVLLNVLGAWAGAVLGGRKTAGREGIAA